MYASNGDTAAIQQAMKQIGVIQTSAAGVVEMTSNAHQAFEALSQALTDLFKKVSPVVEPYPEPAGVGEKNMNNSCEAEAVGHIRRLIERINDKTAEIQHLTAALRV